MTEEKEEKLEKPAKKKKRTKVMRSPYARLTMSQRAEAAALYRSGTVTLEFLSKKYGKRAESFSRLFTKMGIEKGGAVVEAAKKMADVVEARALTDMDETLRKIAVTRDEHFKMASGLAKIAWAELIRARQAGVDVATLKDLMTTLKMTGEVIGNARKELFAVLNVEKYDREEILDDLPELTVRELTGIEVGQLQSQESIDELGTDADVGEGMLASDPLEGL